jgi:hypothetical protein
MRKWKKQKKRPTSLNQLDRHLVNISTGNQDSDIELPTRAQISRLMAELGRKGGKIGGKRRLKTMTAKERSEVAKKAAQARWKAK